MHAETARTTTNDGVANYVRMVCLVFVGPESPTTTRVTVSPAIDGVPSVSASDIVSTFTGSVIYYSIRMVDDACYLIIEDIYLHLALISKIFFVGRMDYCLYRGEDFGMERFATFPTTNFGLSRIEEIVGRVV